MENEQIQKVEVVKKTSLMTKIIAILFGIFIILGFFSTLISSVFDNKTETNIVKEHPQSKSLFESYSPVPGREEMNLSISKGIKNSSMPVLLVKNLNSMDWLECELEINDLYKTTSDIIRTVRHNIELTNEEGDDGSDIHQINEFHQTASIRPNPATDTFKSIKVCCKQPYLSCYAATFDK